MKSAPGRRWPWRRKRPGTGLSRPGFGRCGFRRQYRRPGADQRRSLEGDRRGAASGGSTRATEIGALLDLLPEALRLTKVEFPGAQLHAPEPYRRASETLPYDDPDPVRHRGGSRMIWAMDMDSTLKSAWLEGRSSSQIARQLGHPMTASAVRARARRLNLPMHPEQMVWGGKLKMNGQVTPTRMDKPLPKLKLVGPESAPRPWIERDIGANAAFRSVTDDNRHTRLLRPDQARGEAPLLRLHT